MIQIRLGKRIFIVTIFSLCIALFTLQASPQKIMLDSFVSENMQADILSNNIFYFIETKNNTILPKTINIIPDFSRFKPLKNKKEIESLTANSSIWLCMQVHTETSQDWYIEAGPSECDEIEFFIVKENSMVDYIKTGSSDIKSTRLALSSYIARIPDVPNTDITIYIHYKSSAILTPEINISNGRSFSFNLMAKSVFFGLSIGIILAIFLYTFSLAISIRQPSYAYYLLYILGLFFYLLSVNGFGLLFFWTGNSWFNHRIQTFSSLIMIFGAILFARHYLGTKDKLPIMDFILAIFAFLLACLGFLVFILDYSSAIFISSSIITVSLLILFTTAILSLFTHTRGAIIFIISWSFVILSAIFTQMKLLGFESNNLLSSILKADQFGSLLQVLFLSLGIYESVSRIRSEKEKAQKDAIINLTISNQIKNDFLTAVSTKISSPLNDLTILSAETNLKSCTEYENNLRLINMESKRIYNLISNIAIYIKNKTGTIPFSISNCSLHTIGSGTISILSYLATNPKIIITNNLEHISFHSDENHLNHILYNLLLNSIENTTEGSISIESNHTEKEITISVTDTGIGIKSDNINKNFDPFSEENEFTLTENFGVGLFVAARLISSLGGNLIYEPNIPNGSIFSFTLPLQTNDRITIVPINETNSIESNYVTHTTKSIIINPVESKGTIFILEQNPVAFQARKKELEQEQYSIVGFSNAHDLLSTLHSEISNNSPDLIICDFRINDIPIFDFLKEVRNLYTEIKLPIIILSDDDTKPIIDHCLQTGASDFIKHNSTATIFQAKVNMWIRLKKTVEESVKSLEEVIHVDKLQTLGVLSAGIAHEINNPNNAILGNMTVLKKIWPEINKIIQRFYLENGDFSIYGYSLKDLNDEIEKILLTMQSGSLQIKKIVDDLKNYVKASNTIDSELIDLNTVVDYARRLFSLEAKKHIQHIQIVLSEKPVLVKGDLQRLTQVLLNLIDNACAAISQENDYVKITVLDIPEKGCAKLIVEDSGTGIPLHIINHIFDPFFTTKRDIGGTGLGLPVSLGIIKNYGGSLTITNRETKGTIATCTLKRVELNK